MKRVFLLLLCLILVCASSPVLAAMTSTHYQINWDSLNEGGLDVGTSTNYLIRDTLGESVAGVGTSTNFQLNGGYRANDTDPALSLVVRAQSDVSEVGYTAFDFAGKTVTLTSAAGFSNGDYIAVIENKGFSEKVAVGKVINVSGLVITVDAFAGAGVWMGGVPAGGDDFVYRLSGSAIAFGSVNANTAHTATVMTSVQSSSVNGYTVYVAANQLLQNGSAQVMATVLDGTVSLGREEYGASTTGTHAYQPDIDLGVTTTQRIVGQSVSASGDPADRVVVIYKLSTVLGTNPGVYSQNSYYTLTANY